MDKFTPSRAKPNVKDTGRTSLRQENSLRLASSNNVASFNKGIKPETFLTIEAVAELIGCSTRHVYNEVNNNSLKAYKIARRLRFDPAEVTKWIARKAL